MQINVTLPSGEARSIELGAGGVVVGSAAGCDFVLASPEVSPRHAFFQIDPVGAPTVQEMGTTSAVFVNGSRITGTVALKSSDQVSIGGATFTLGAPSPAAAQPPAAAAPTVPTPVVAPPPSTPASTPAPAVSPTPAPAEHGSPFKSPLILVLIGVAVLLGIGLVVVARNMGGNDELTPLASAAPSEGPSEEPTDAPAEEPTEEPTIATPPPVSKARIDGLYSGKYDFAFKANCPSGPCGGLAQSGAQFRIPYSGSSSYRGHSTLRDTCSDGGVHVQAPYKVDLVFHATDATTVGDEWKATKVDINLTISRNAVKKKVRTSPTFVTTLTCPAYNKNVHFIAVAAS